MVDEVWAGVKPVVGGWVATGVEPDPVGSVSATVAGSICPIRRERPATIWIA